VLVLRDWCHVCHLKCFTCVTSPLSAQCTTIFPQLQSDFGSLCIQNLAVMMCSFYGRSRLKPDGTRWRTGGEVKGKLANGVCSQSSHTTSEHGVSSITNANAHTSAASSRMNWRPRRFKWTRPFLRKTKSCFCACAIRFQMSSTKTVGQQHWGWWELRDSQMVYGVR
jgi:hypothetical protein